MAFFVSLRKNPKVEFVSVPQHQAGTIIVLIAVLFQAAMGFYDFFTYTSVLNGKTEEKGEVFSGIASAVVYAVALTLLTYFGRIYYWSLHKLAEVEKNFDVRNCECGVPADQPMLLSSIQQFMGSNDSQNDGIEIFNDLVRRNLRLHAPFSGPRSILVISYIPCFIAGSFLQIVSSGNNISWLALADYWSSGRPGFAEVNISFRWAIWLAYDHFIVKPVGVFCFLVLIKAVWWIEKQLDLKHFVWISTLYSALVVFDYFVPVRTWLIHIVVSEPAGAFFASHEETRWHYHFPPFPFLDLPSIFKDPKPLGLGWFSDVRWKKFLIPVWGRVLVIIWLVVSTFGTYWLFESVYLKRLRLKAWKLVRKRIWCAKKRKD